MTKVPCRQTPVKNISIHGFRPVKDEEQRFDTESCLKGNISVWVLSGAGRGPGEEKKTGKKRRENKGGLNPPLFFHVLYTCVLSECYVNAHLDEAVFGCCSHTSDEDSHNAEKWGDDGKVFKGKQSEKRNRVNDGCTTLMCSAFTQSGELEKGKGTVLNMVSPTQTALISVQFQNNTGDFISVQEY